MVQLLSELRREAQRDAAHVVRSVLTRVASIGFAGLSGRNTEKSTQRTCCGVPVVLSVVVRLGAAAARSPSRDSRPH